MRPKDANTGHALRASPAAQVGHLESALASVVIRVFGVILPGRTIPTARYPSTAP